MGGEGCRIFIELLQKNTYARLKKLFIFLQLFLNTTIPLEFIININGCCYCAFKRDLFVHWAGVQGAQGHSPAYAFVLQLRNSYMYGLWTVHILHCAFSYMRAFLCMHFSCTLVSCLVFSCNRLQSQAALSIEICERVLNLVDRLNRLDSFEED